jgi:hypothetical protein
VLVAAVVFTRRSLQLEREQDPDPSEAPHER